jgi:hypothetical protein
MDTMLRLLRNRGRIINLLRRDVRAAGVPVLVCVGLLTVIAWAIGTQNGNRLLLWSPAAYAWILACSYALTRALHAPAGWTGPPRDRG